MKNKFNLLFLASAAFIELFFLLFTAVNMDGNIPLYIFVWFQAFLIFLLAVYLVRKKLIDFRISPALISIPMRMLNINKDISVPLLIVLSGLIFRLTLFPAELTTSPDAYRYVWEGKVIFNGYNPYVYAPVDEKLRHLHSEDLPSKINHNERTAIYPPAAQYLFVLSYLVSGEDLQGLKLLYLLFEALTLIFLLKLLYLKNKDMNLVILYAWLPLPIMEFFINTHLDVFGISFLVMFIYFLEKKKYFTSSVFFALSFLTKFYPVFLFPLLLKKAGVKNTVISGLVLLTMTLLFYLPFISGEVNLFSFLVVYLEKWEFNASVYYLLRLFLSGETARILCALMFLAGIGIISYRYKEFTKAALGVFILMIIFATTVYPWYLGWLAVLTPLHLFYSVIGLAFTINLSNVTPMSPVWTEYTPVIITEYVVFYVLLWWDGRKGHW